MSSRSKVRDASGNVTHVRITSDDGTKSRLYEAKEGFLGTSTGKCVEVARHRPDGTTKAYEAHETPFGIHTRQ